MYVGGENGEAGVMPFERYTVHDGEVRENGEADYITLERYTLHDGVHS
jgi:hypothetical protein